MRITRAKVAQSVRSGLRPDMLPTREIQRDEGAQISNNMGCPAKKVCNGMRAQRDKGRGSGRSHSEGGRRAGSSVTLN